MWLLGKADMKNLVVTWAALAAVGWMAGCSARTTGACSGYAQGDFVDVTSPRSGLLTKLAVSPGEEVKEGQVLFVLEHGSESAALRDAKTELGQAHAHLDDLRAKRPSGDAASLQTTLEKAKSKLHLAEFELERRQKLLEEGVLNPPELELAKNLCLAYRAEVASWTAAVSQAGTEARAEERKAVEEEAKAWNTVVDDAQSALAQTSPTAPMQATVQQTFCREGEFVKAGSRVLSLLPPGHITVRFFVPATRVASFKPGTAVSVSWGQKPIAAPATVTFVSDKADYVPDSDANGSLTKQRIRVEAKLSPPDALALRPGQSVEVRPASPSFATSHSEKPRARR